MPVSRTFIPSFAVVFALSVTAGCAGRGDLSGTVTLEGKKLTQGSVLVLGSDGQHKASLISKDGSYEVKDVAAGTVKIMVTSPDPGEMKEIPRKPLEPQPPPKDRAGWFPIHENYGDFEKSGITFELGRGPNSFDIQLKEKGP